MANFDTFMALYSANFGKRLDASDGLQFWKDFVEKSDGEILKAAVDSLIGEMEARRAEKGLAKIPAPPLAQVKKRYWDFRDKAQKSERMQLGTLGKCVHCDNCGYVWVCLGLRSRHAVDVRKPFDEDVASPSIAACLCEAGSGFDPAAPPEWRRRNAEVGLPPVGMWNADKTEWIRSDTALARLSKMNKKDLSTNGTN